MRICSRIIINWIMSTVIWRVYLTYISGKRVVRSSNAVIRTISISSISIPGVFMKIKTNRDIFDNEI